jgi:4a-hydroxytetrahydrobiopterin dehydratase
MERLSEEAVASAVERLSWDRDGDKLVKVVRRRDFADAMVFVNAVAQMAEATNHHPDIEIHWNEVTLRLWTHSSGGITQADIDLAAGIDGLEAA